MSLGLFLLELVGRLTFLKTGAPSFPSVRFWFLLKCKYPMKLAFEVVIITYQYIWILYEKIICDRDTKQRGAYVVGRRKPLSGGKAWEWDPRHLCHLLPNFAWKQVYLQNPLRDRSCTCLPRITVDIPFYTGWSFLTLWFRVIRVGSDYLRVTPLPWSDVLSIVDDSLGEKGQ